MARLSGPAIQGEGELWIAGDGLPARLVLDLEWANRGKEPYTARVVSTTDYRNFGR